MHRLQIHMQTHDEGVFALGLQFGSGERQRGGAAHRIQHAERPLRSQERVDAQPTHTHRPGERIACTHTHTHTHTHASRSCSRAQGEEQIAALVPSSSTGRGTVNGTSCSGSMRRCPALNTLICGRHSTSVPGKHA